ncbi:MAG: NAD(P)H-hydrate dehydratase [Rhodospirillaceae bacterium]|jgi:ADP-dependent NAD(P)H-hydrate dehydratase / NAD(P)H-hydrate epimerase|nr:NAD(P)H-hydrate dehydratase [Rhodospirillaceae bacterium]
MVFSVFSNAILSVDEMYRADAAAIAAGTPGLALMENAGSAITDAITDRWTPRPTAILCGPGNNGGDGFVVARLLTDRGWPVRLALLGDVSNLKGDAAANAERWSGDILPLNMDILSGAELVVDALFGAGLARAVDGVAADIINAVNAQWLPCVAVDTPSGIHGDSGQVLGTAPHAELTVTFFRPKPAHLLMPGRSMCGDLVVADIGIPDAVLEEIGPLTQFNGPEIWAGRFPWPAADGHKYGRGHAVIAGGDTMTGAARLAATAARRMGAGLVTIASSSAAFAIYAGSDPGNLVTEAANGEAFSAFLHDPRRNAVLIGPGAGIGEQTRAKVLAALSAEKACVLDADALTSFAGEPETLFAAINQPCVLTPHEGEFQRLFGASDGEDKVSRARRAAQASGAVVLLKGADTVIAAPNGRVAINDTGTPFLATAGSGDVLAGMIVGLLAQGMDAIDAARAGAWLHGMAAEEFGPGLIAEDLVDMIPDVLAELLDNGAEWP